MIKIDLKLLKQLREETTISIADCRRALEEVGNEYEKAVEWLRKNGIEKADKKSERETMQGMIYSYVHQAGKIASMIELSCETDFVARTEEFKKLAHEIAMQVVAMNPKNLEELLNQEYIRDTSKTIRHLIKESIAKMGENTILKRFIRYELGSE